MLRKRTRSHQKDQHMNNLIPDPISESYFHSDISNQKHKINLLLKVPGLFVGFNPKSSEFDSVRSPTSPLDFRIFSSFGNPFRCPKSQNEGHQKSWDSSKVGLSIIDSLDGETNQSGKNTLFSDNKNIIFGRQRSVRGPTFCGNARSLEMPKSLPKNVAVFPSTLVKPSNTNSDVMFEIGEGLFELGPCESFRARSMDSGRYGSHLTNFGNRKPRLGSGNFFLENKTNPMTVESGLIGGSLKLDNTFGGRLGSIDSIPAGEIELSEDYTCVRTHGPNPKVTHIFGDCILECHNDKLTDLSKQSEDDNDASVDGQFNDDVLPFYPSDDFLKFCYSCHKKLDGEDIYMYRGEKAFCSYICRSQEIEIEEEMEKSNNDSSGISDSSLFIAA